ncbi:MAG: prenyltransferase [Ilumatobacteraceae bacterium]
MTNIPHIEGVLSADEVVRTAESIAALQLDSGMIPWFEGGHCDPWNHVETAMALDVAGLHREAERAYEWLIETQHRDGWWFNYYLPGGLVEEPKLDTNVCAYVAAGVWHHWLCTWDRGFVDHLWPTVERAIDWVLSMRRHDGTVLWAREEHSSPWDYALLTGSSSIWHALTCAVELADLVGESRPDWQDAAEVLRTVIIERPDAFEPKDRWAMDWYYPVLTNALEGDSARSRLDDGWNTFAMPGKGIRCVSDEPWITAAETAECSLAYSSVGDIERATDLLAWTRSHRHDDGSYWTGVVYPSRENFPAGERTAYTGAAVVLAADAITSASPASRLFIPSLVAD